MRRTLVAVFSAVLALGALPGQAQVAWPATGSISDNESFLGVHLQDVTAESAEALNLPAERGARCVRVLPDTPAEKAGMVTDDVIIDWNGTRVEGARQLQRLVAETPVGRTVSLEVVRDGETQQLAATVGERGDLGVSARSFPDFYRNQIPLGPWHPPIDNPDAFPGLFPPQRPRLGIMMQPLTEQLAGFFGLGEDEGGVLVVSVVEDSAAEAAGLRAGDVITEIGGESVGTPAEVQAEIRRVDGLVDLTIFRDKGVVHVEVNLAEDSESAPAADDDGEALKEELSFPRGSM